MPLLDDNIEDLDSSPDPNLDAKSDDAAKAADQTTDAGSSDATGEKTDDNLLSVVRDVVKESREPQTASPAEGEEDQDQDGKTKEDDEDYSDVPFHKHPRFQHVLRTNKALKQEVEHFKVDAERYQNVQNFLDTAGLAPDEAANGLSIMGMAKTDPAGAWKAIKPWVQKLLIASGEVLPDDLKQRVGAGEMTQEAALELSRSRATNESSKAAQSFREQQAQRIEQSKSVNALKTAAQEWEDNRRSRDPNFEAKVHSLMKEVAYLQRTEGQPKTPQGVKDQLAKAYKIANEGFRSPAPANVQRKPAIRPVTGGRVAGETRTEPKNYLDIVRANRQQHA